MSKREKVPATEAALRDLYAQVPQIACKRLCGHAYCGPIAMTHLELAILTSSREMPADVAPFGPGTVIISDGSESYIGGQCPMLDLGDGTCTAYADRPLLCRIWGAVEKLRCPHGCEPARMLSNAEGHALLNQVARLSAAWTRARGGKL